MRDGIKLQTGLSFRAAAPPCAVDDQHAYGARLPESVKKPAFICDALIDSNDVADHAIINGGTSL